MSSDFPTELRKELLDDFYAECDELLSAIRESLALLEQNAAVGDPDPAVIETLFRNLHSIKGISAIVGLRPAEELAHSSEDLLRGLSKREFPLTDAMIESLLVSAQRLEQIVASHRLQKPLPDIQDALVDLRRQIPSKKRARSTEKNNQRVGAPTSQSNTDPVRAARNRGLQLWICTFQPSADLDQRGVNINAIRERLGLVGEILSATPSVRADGSISFEFLVGFEKAPVDLATWEADGMKLRPAPAAAPEVHPIAPTPIRESDTLEALSLTPSHMVRVDLARLEDLMRITGEMVIHRFRLEDRLDHLVNPPAELREINLAMARSLRELREAISRVRTVPIAEIFTRMPFVVRDLTRTSDKKARVVLEGRQTEIDKYLVERLKEPLLHLVRNAFSHGVESPKKRAAAGKPKEATILLRATSEGENVVIQIRDDGRGMDLSAIAARAADLGIAVPEPLEMSDVLNILCIPGFSTRTEADLASGRGVGMAVVATTVRELGGTLSLETSLGAGSVFTLRLPLTLSISAAFIVSVEDQTCAVPQGAVDEVIQMGTSEIRRIKETEVIPYRGGLLPLVRLGEMFKIPAVPSPSLTILVLRSERGATGLVVDRVRGLREVVIRPLSDPLLRVRGISGATELGDGRPILILDPAAITQGVIRPTDNARNPVIEKRAVPHAS